MELEGVSILRSREGQSSVFDATIFLAILLVASALVINISTYMLQAEDAQSFENLQTYTTRLANAVLESTVPNASYSNVEGESIVRRDISVQDMIVEELLMTDNGIPEGNFWGNGNYNERIREVLNSLVDEDLYSYELLSSFRGMEMVIGDSNGIEREGSETCAHTSMISLASGSEQITITLFVWRG